MRKIVIFGFFFSTFVFADLSVEQIRQMVTKIHEKREGIRLETLEATQEPFVRMQEENNVTTFIIPEKTFEDTKLELHGILNGKAYINNDWTKVGDTISGSGYVLKYIGRNGAVLRSGNQIKKLYLRKKRKNFIIVEGRE